MFCFLHKEDVCFLFTLMIQFRQSFVTRLIAANCIQWWKWPCLTGGSVHGGGGLYI